MQEIELLPWLYLLNDLVLTPQTKNEEMMNNSQKRLEEFDFKVRREVGKSDEETSFELVDRGMTKVQLIIKNGTGSESVWYRREERER